MQPSKALAPVSALRQQIDNYGRISEALAKGARFGATEEALAQHGDVADMIWGLRSDIGALRALLLTTVGYAAFVRGYATFEGFYFSAGASETAQATDFSQLVGCIVSRMGSRIEPWLEPLLYDHGLEYPVRLHGRLDADYLARLGIPGLRQAPVHRIVMPDAVDALPRDAVPAGSYASMRAQQGVGELLIGPRCDLVRAGLLVDPPTVRGAEVHYWEITSADLTPGVASRLSSSPRARVRLGLVQQRRRFSPVSRDRPSTFTERWHFEDTMKQKGFHVPPLPLAVDLDGECAVVERYLSNLSWGKSPDDASMKFRWEREVFEAFRSKPSLGRQLLERSLVELQSMKQAAQFVTQLPVDPQIQFYADGRVVLGDTGPLTTLARPARFASNRLVLMNTLNLLIAWTQELLDGSW